MAFAETQVLLAALRLDTSQFDTAANRSAARIRALEGQLQRSAQRSAAAGLPAGERAASADVLARQALAVERLSNRLALGAKAISSAATRSIIVMGGLGAVAIKVFSDVQESQAALARTLYGESAPAIKHLQDQIIELSKTIPLPITELNRIAEVIGTTNVAADSIDELTKVVAQLAVTTDLSADEAAIGLSRLLNMFGQIDKSGHIATGAAEGLASALYKSSLAFASSDQEVLRAALRFGALSHSMGITEGQVLALAGAVTGLGQEPEAVGGSFQRVFQIINKAVGQADKLGKSTPALKEFAKLAGLTPKAFGEGIKTAPFETFIKVIEGFSKLSPTEQAVLFGQGGVFPSFVRGAQTLQNLGLAWETVLVKSKEFDQEIKDGQALQTAFQARIDTLQLKFQLLQSALVRGAVAFAGAFNVELGDAIKTITQYIDDSIPVIEQWGRDFAKWIKSIDWQAVLDFGKTFLGIMKDIASVIANLPQPVLAALAGIKAANFLTGGVAGDVLGGLAGTLTKAFSNVLSKIPILGAAFVQPVYVTNMGPGGLGGAGAGGGLAMLGVVGVAIANLALLPTAIQGTLDTISGALEGSAKTLQTGIQGIVDYLKVNPFSAGWATLLQTLIDRLPGGGGGGGKPGPEGISDPTSVGDFTAAAEGARLSQSVGDLTSAAEGLHGSVDYLADAAGNLTDASRKFLDSLKPQHRPGERGRSIQSTEGRKLLGLDVTGSKFDAALADLVAHYTKEPIGSPGHSRGFVLGNLNPIENRLGRELKAALKAGDGGRADDIVASLRSLDKVPKNELPGWIRKLIARADANSDEEKHKQQQTKNAINTMADRTSGALGTVRRAIAAKRLSVRVAAPRVNIRGAPVHVGATVVRVTVGTRTVTRVVRTQTAYGPNLVFQQPGQIYEGPN